MRKQLKRLKNIRTDYQLSDANGLSGMRRMHTGDYQEKPVTKHDGMSLMRDLAGRGDKWLLKGYNVIMSSWYIKLLRPSSLDLTSPDVRSALIKFLFPGVKYTQYDIINGAFKRYGIYGRLAIDRQVAAYAKEMQDPNVRASRTINNEITVRISAATKEKKKKWIENHCVTYVPEIKGIRWKL